MLIMAELESNYPCNHLAGRISAGNLAGILGGISSRGGRGSFAGILGNSGALLQGRAGCSCNTFISKSNQIKHFILK